MDNSFYYFVNQWEKGNASVIFLALFLLPFCRVVYVLLFYNRQKTRTMRSTDLPSL